MVIRLISNVRAIMVIRVISNIGVFRVISNISVIRVIRFMRVHTHTLVKQLILYESENLNTTYISYTHSFSELG